MTKTLRKISMLLIALALMITGFSLHGISAKAGGDLDLPGISGVNSDGTISVGQTVYVTMASLDNSYGDFSTLYKRGEVYCMFTIRDASGDDYSYIADLQNGRFSYTTSMSEINQYLSFSTHTATGATHYNNNTASYRIVTDKDDSGPYTVQALEKGGTVTAKRATDSGNILYKFILSAETTIKLHTESSDQYARKVTVYSSSAATSGTTEYTYDWPATTYDVEFKLKAGKHYLLINTTSQIPKEITVSWKDGTENEDLDHSIEFSVLEGSARGFTAEGKNNIYYYYKLYVGPDSNKFTFSSTQKRGYIWLMKGSTTNRDKSMFNGSTGQLAEGGDGLEETLILQPGTYTIVVAAPNYAVPFIVKNTAFAGLTALGGSSSIVVPVNQTKTYKLKMTPETNDVTVKYKKSASTFTIKKVSKSEYNITAGKTVGSATLTFTSETLREVMFSTVVLTLS